ncbi:membrane protein-like protein [Dinothrombium tinctorium]|uniref:BOS complex subunit TMEM147 n=1 Tax=Dinothrombium tinctorium TaxID=1965070 RepID=A0A443R6E7_9ACAR|nr:membrane protein-like protein [Dinothrombium tinctorium]
MTFYYFVNCVLLTFGPLFFVYKFTSLSEYGSIWRCGIALFGYIVTQICKLLIIATLMAPALIWGYLVDVIGIYWVLIKQQKASLSQVKILGVAVGWSFGESLLTRFVDYYVNARSMQFDWKHMLTAIDANLALIQNICICCLLWLWSRGGQKLPVAIVILYFIALTAIGANLMLKSSLVLVLSIGTLFAVN